MIFVNVLCEHFELESLLKIRFDARISKTADFMIPYHLPPTKNMAWDEELGCQLFAIPQQHGAFCISRVKAASFECFRPLGLVQI